MLDIDELERYVLYLEKEIQKLRSHISLEGKNETDDDAGLWYVSEGGAMIALEIQKKFFYVLLLKALEEKNDE